MPSLPAARAISAALGVLSIAAAARAQTFTPIASSAIAAHVAFSTGATWIDFDGDGDLDVFVVTGFSANNANVLYRNDGGSFVSVTGVPLVQDFAESVCSTWADADNDGDVDAFVSNLVDQGGMFYRGQGAGDLALDTASGLGGSGQKGTGAAWGDYDNDGWLDLVVAALYGQGGIATGNRLFHNDGNGTFTEITTGPEVTTLDTHHHPTWSDYDGDGDLDLFFATGPVGSTDRDRLYRNRLKETGTATFEAITTGTIATDFRDSQVLSWVDYDDDGDLDLYAVNYTSVPNQLYRNDGGVFTRILTGAIVTDAGAAHGVVWGDFDNDGDQDAYVVRDLQQSNRYYRNDGAGTFTSITSGGFVNEGLSNYGAAAGDFDADGDLDLFVPTARSEAASVLYRNDLANGNHWLIVVPRGSFSNRSGVGAKVRVRATIGGVPRWQMREIKAGTSYGGHDALEAHFGLGDAAIADSVRVEWPSGLADAVTGVSANARRAVVEGETLAGVADQKATLADLEVTPHPFTRQSRLTFRLARTEAVTLEAFDAAGRRIDTIEGGVFPAGKHSMAIGRLALPRPGVYLLRLRAGGASVPRRIVRVP
jgi:enediyne biosynthesis protein E4